MSDPEDEVTPPSPVRRASQELANVQLALASKVERTEGRIDRLLDEVRDLRIELGEARREHRHDVEQLRGELQEVRTLYYNLLDELGGSR